LTTPFVPAVREDGSFDPDCLEQAGLRWVTAWLKSRFQGSDPYFPIDRRYGEDPEALIVSILQDAGLAHPATDLIARALLEMLDEARAKAPEVPAYFEPAVRVCQRVRLPHTGDWFEESLKALAENPSEEEAHWSRKLIAEILFAATVQAPGLPQAASRRNWESILRLPNYATLGWLGLAQTFASAASYVAAWWQACPPEDRHREIDQWIYAGLKTETADGVLRIVGTTGYRWPRDLRAAVELALRKNGVQKPLREFRTSFASRRYSSFRSPMTMSMKLSSRRLDMQSQWDMNRWLPRLAQFSKTKSTTPKS